MPFVLETYLKPQALLLPHRPPPLLGKPGVAAEFPCPRLRYLSVLQHCLAGDTGGLPSSLGLFPHHPAALFLGLSLCHSQAKKFSKPKIASPPWMSSACLGDCSLPGGSPLGWWHPHLPGVRNGVAVPSSHGVRCSSVSLLQGHPRSLWPVSCPFPGPGLHQAGGCWGPLPPASPALLRLV